MEWEIHGVNRPAEAAGWHLDVVARGRACLQPDGLANDESDCFGFGLPHGLADGALVTTMQELVGEFMDDD